MDLDLDDPMTQVLIELGLLEAERTVKVFDPETMMPKALEKAAAVAGTPRTPRVIMEMLEISAERMRDKLMRSIDSL